MAQPGPATKSNAAQFFKRRHINSSSFFFLPYVLIPSADSCHALFSLSFVPRNNSFKLFKTLCLVYIIYFVFRWDRIAFWYIDKRQGVRGNASHGKYEVFEGQKRCFFCILVDCYHCITDSVTPRRQPKKSLFKRTKYNVVFLVDSVHKLQK